MNKKNVVEYLDRLGLNYPEILSLDFLQAIHKAHMQLVPFENIDIQLGVHIDLNIDSLFKKIIVDRRGGICYELNGLFFELLKTLGFEVKRISGRVFNKSKNVYGDEFDHLACLVQIHDEEYLCDVGFGDFSLSPLILKKDLVQKSVIGDFILENYDDDYIKVNKVGCEGAYPLYIFKSVHRGLEEFCEMSIFHQTSTNSIFTRSLLITKPFGLGRITVSGDNLIIKELNHKVRLKFLEGNELLTIIGIFFGDQYVKLLTKIIS